MGFRSTFSTQEYPNIDWPQWFRDKYADTVHINDRGGMVSRRESKTYTTWKDLPDDIRKAIDWEDVVLHSFVVVFLHECGGVTRCQIERDAIKWSEPLTWEVTPGITHNYCYGCSDV
jgi:hypothetical protein